MEATGPVPVAEDDPRASARSQAFLERPDPRVIVRPMPAAFESELERFLEQARELLGAGDDTLLAEANTTVNQALQLSPDCVEAWLLKCQVASATGDDLA